MDKRAHRLAMMRMMMEGLYSLKRSHSMRRQFKVKLVQEPLLSSSQDVNCNTHSNQTRIHAPTTRTHSFQLTTNSYARFQPV